MGDEEAGGEEEDEEDGWEITGLLRVKVSPAPSQSELVKMGV